MNQDDRFREVPGGEDPLAKLLASLREAPTERCNHITDQPGQLWWRDLRAPEAVVCQECVTRGRGSALCCVCGWPQRGAYVADFKITVHLNHAVQTVALLCGVCVGLLPGDVTTLQLDKGGVVRVNRPGGGTQ